MSSNYSSSIKSKHNPASTKKTMSNIRSICSQPLMSPNPLPPKTNSVDATAQIIIGIIIGKNKIGSITSLALVFTEIAESSVPTTARPKVAIIKINANSILRRFISKRIAKTGSINSSTNNIKR